MSWRITRIAALEDKIVQQAVVTVLTPIYEANFLGFSYGFRPGRNQQAWAAKAADVRLSGVHPHLWKAPVPATVLDTAKGLR